MRSCALRWKRRREGHAVQIDGRRDAVVICAEDAHSARSECAIQHPKGVNEYGNAATYWIPRFRGEDSSNRGKGAALLHQQHIDGNAELLSRRADDDAVDR